MLLTIIFFEYFGYAQSITISGKVTDSLQNPLEYANILAIPKTDDQELTFAITKAACRNNTNKQTFLTSVET